jgi:hypothetical protein
MIDSARELKWETTQLVAAANESAKRMGNGVLFEHSLLKNYRALTFWTQIVLGLMYLILFGVSIISLFVNDDQSSFVYLSIYDGPLFGSKQTLNPETMISMDHHPQFHPQWLMCIPSGIMSIFLLISIVYSRHLRTKGQGDLTWSDLAAHQKHYFFAHNYSRYFFGTASSWVVTVVMFVYGLRDASHLTTLFVFHVVIFASLYPTMLAQLSSVTPIFTVDTGPTFSPPTDYDDLGLWGKITVNCSYYYNSAKRGGLAFATFLLYFIPLSLIATVNWLITTDVHPNENQHVTVLMIFVYVYITICCFGKAYSDYQVAKSTIHPRDVATMIRVQSIMLMVLAVMIGLMVILLHASDEAL